MSDNVVSIVPHYLIWSIDHKAWWKPLQRGYTEYYQEAGTYTKEDAFAICQPLPERGIEEIPVRLTDVMGCWE